ncbi:hypothetical protein XbrCFBP1976_03220 [Xanthomonas bromi]|uniref:Uncharacterized protein n=1 Tax=Xanthomonas bromi TaxID=56449 RepID=A0ABX5BVF9_9XANT|nr:hypothetical protein XbrCFBP1976_03220 [Xanthomonas bromi]
MGLAAGIASDLVGAEGDYSIPAVGQRMGLRATTSDSCVVELVAEGRVALPWCCNGMFALASASQLRGIIRSRSTNAYGPESRHLGEVTRDLPDRWHRDPRPTSREREAGVSALVIGAGGWCPRPCCCYALRC